MENLIKKYPALTGKVLQLHPFQSNAIKAVLEGKNSLVIAPTGKGKSLIYQIAGQELNGITIVVSPLVALINEQAGLLGNDLALRLNSSLSFQEQREILHELASGAYLPKFIFLSPERLQNYFFRAALKKSGLQVAMVVVDEAHCISQWGFDFRPDYSQIDYFVAFLKGIGQKPVILAMTATIGNLAQKDIVAEFNIKPESVFYDHDVWRKELKLNFIKVEKEKEKPGKIFEILDQYQPKKVIIYFYDKPNCRKIAQKLNSKGIKAATFYNGMEAEDKSENYINFKQGKINVLCATTAFGMGMNIPDIDMVIHHRLPDSIEEYYQQVGRAARDKELCPEAHCFALWSQVNIDYKYDEFIPAVMLQPDGINAAFQSLGTAGKAGKTQSLEYSNYVIQNLGRIRFAFEKRGILRTIGELNGSPKSIVFKKANPYWDEIVEKMNLGNSFIRAADNSGLDLQELIDYVFEQELSGEIKKFPAMQKKIFFVSDYDEVPLEVVYNIVEESIKLSQFKEQQVKKLEEMIQSDDREQYIKAYFEASTRHE